MVPFSTISDINWYQILVSGTNGTITKSGSKKKRERKEEEERIQREKRNQMILSIQKFIARLQFSYLRSITKGVQMKYKIAEMKLTNFLSITKI